MAVLIHRNGIATARKRVRILLHHARWLAHLLDMRHKTRCHSRTDLRLQSCRLAVVILRVAVRVLVHHRLPGRLGRLRVEAALEVVATLLLFRPLLLDR